MKLLEENIREKPSWLLTVLRYNAKGTIHKIKKSINEFHQNETLAFQKMLHWGEGERQTDCEKTFASYISDQRHVSRI